MWACSNATARGAWPTRWYRRASALGTSPWSGRAACTCGRGSGAQLVAWRGAGRAGQATPSGRPASSTPPIARQGRASAARAYPATPTCSRPSIALRLSPMLPPSTFRTPPAQGAEQGQPAAGAHLLQALDRLAALAHVGVQHGPVVPRVQVLAVPPQDLVRNRARDGGGAAAARVGACALSRRGPPPAAAAGRSLHPHPRPHPPPTHPHIRPHAQAGIQRTCV